MNRYVIEILSCKVTKCHFRKVYVTSVWAPEIVLLYTLYWQIDSYSLCFGEGDIRKPDI